MAAIYEEKRLRVQAMRFDGTTDDLMAVANWIQENGYVWYDPFTPAPPRGVTMYPATGFMQLVDSKGQAVQVKRGEWVLLMPDGDFKSMTVSEFQARFEFFIES